MKTSIIVVLISLNFLLPSCEKLNFSKEPMSPKEASDCHKQFEWNRPMVRDALTGKWMWIYSKSYFGREMQSKDQNVFVEFLSDSTLVVTGKGTQAQMAHWQVVPADGGLYELDLDPSISLFYGRIYFCNDLVKFNFSYLDGTDNFFQKVN